MNELVRVEEKEVERVRAELAPVLEAAQKLEVVNELTYGQALALGADCAARARHVEEVFTPAREAAYNAWKAVTSLIGSFVDPLNKAKELCGKKARDWKRAEDERREQEAREKAEAERKRLEEEALTKAAALEQQGKAEEAEAALVQPVVVPPPEPPKVGKLPGTSFRSNWQAEVTDFRALVVAVAKGEVDLAVLQPNEKELKARAKALKADMKYPGVRVWDEGSTVFRGGR